MFDAAAAANLIASLKIMGLGMGGIFAVMLIIMGVVALLGRFGADEEEPSGKSRRTPLFYSFVRTFCAAW